MNKAYNSKQFLQKKKRAKKVKIWLFVILGFMVMVGFFYWMRQPSLNIEKIEVVKNSFSKTENIEASVSSVLDGDFFFLIPKTNTLTLPKNEVEEKLKKDFPDIEKVNINRKGLQQIKVEVYEYEPKIVLRLKDKNYFVNKEGNVFLEEPLINSYDDLLELDMDMDTVEIGQNVLDPDFLKGLSDFVQKMKDLDIRVSKVFYKGEDVYRLNTNIGFEIVVSSKDDLSLDFDNVQTIIENGALKMEDLDLIDYMDLRFGNKVFYKLKGE